MSEELPVVYRTEIHDQWNDRNGHFNAGYYMVVFDTAIGRWLDVCGVDTPHRRSHAVTTFTAESHTTYLRELRAGESVAVTAQLLDFSDKKVHTFLRMMKPGDGSLAATNEVLSLHIDLESRRPAPFADVILERLRELAQRHRTLPHPSQAGRVIGVAATAPAKE